MFYKATNTCYDYNTKKMFCKKCLYMVNVNELQISIESIMHEEESHNDLKRFGVNSNINN